MMGVVVDLVRYRRREQDDAARRKERARRGLAPDASGPCRREGAQQQSHH